MNGFYLTISLLCILFVGVAVGNAIGMRSATANKSKSIYFESGVFVGALVYAKIKSGEIECGNKDIVDCIEENASIIFKERFGGK